MQEKKKKGAPDPAEEFSATLEVTEEILTEDVREGKGWNTLSVVLELLGAFILTILAYYGYTTIEGNRIGGVSIATTIAVSIFSLLLGYRKDCITKNKWKLTLCGTGFVLVLIINHVVLQQLSLLEEIDYTMGYVLFIGACLSTVFSLWESKRTKQLYELCPLVWNLLLMGMISFFTFFILEMCTGTNITTIDSRYWMMNILMYCSIYGLLYVITMRMKLSLLLGLLLCTIAGLANGFVILFRGSPILPADLYLIKTAMEVGGNYSFTPTTEMWIGLAGIVLSIMLICNIKEKKLKWKSRLAVTILYVILVGAGVTHFVEVAQTQLYMVNLWQPVKTYQRYGSGYGFGLNMVAMQVQKPGGYSEEEVQKILGEYTSDPMPDTDSASMPNIIAITCEAFSDLQVINEFTTNEAYMPYLSSLTENIIKGNAYASVLGGRTSNSEYEFLTGNAITYLPAGTVPYQQYINGETDNLTSLLKSMNYSAIALHPYSRNTYRREIVYPLLGFDEYVSQENFVNPSYLRYYIKDESDFKKIIELYENRDTTKSFFLYNVTMQNHSAYNTGKMDYNIWVTEEDGVTKKEEYTQASEYLSLISETDAALKELIEYFEGQEEPTYIILFGDHQPILDDGFIEELFDGKTESELSVEELQSRYTVPFFIWSNQDIEEKTVERISLNYLSSYLLKEAGMPLTAFNKYMLDLYEKIPVVNINGYIDQNGEYYDTTEMKDNALLQKYNMVLYHSVMNNNKGVEWAYTLQE